jgi:hypothetical protein
VVVSESHAGTWDISWPRCVIDVSVIAHCIVDPVDKCYFDGIGALIRHSIAIRIEPPIMHKPMGSAGDSPRPIPLTFGDILHKKSGILEVLVDICRLLFVTIF